MEATVQQIISVTAQHHNPSAGIGDLVNSAQIQRANPRNANCRKGTQERRRRVRVSM